MRHIPRSFPQALAFILIALTALFVSCGSSTTPGGTTTPGGGNSATIVSFTAPSSVLPGQKFTISWVVKDAVNVTLNQASQTTNSTERTMELKPMTFVLAVKGKDGKEASQSLTVNVASLPQSKAIVYLKRFEYTNTATDVFVTAGYFAATGVKFATYNGMAFLKSAKVECPAPGGIRIFLVANNAQKEILDDYCIVIQTTKTPIPLLSVVEYGGKECGLQPVVYLLAGANTIKISLGAYQSLFIIDNLEKPVLRANPAYTITDPKDYTVTTNSSGGIAVIGETGCRQNMQ